MKLEEAFQNRERSTHATVPTCRAFPDMGSMLTKPGAIKYDPQLIKPPAGYLGR